MAKDFRVEYKKSYDTFLSCLEDLNKRIDRVMGVIQKLFKIRTKFFWSFYKTSGELLYNQNKELGIFSDVGCIEIYVYGTGCYEEILLEEIFPEKSINIGPILDASDEEIREWIHQKAEKLIVEAQSIKNKNEAESTKKEAVRKNKLKLVRKLFKKSSQTISSAKLNKIAALLK